MTTWSKQWSKSLVQKNTTPTRRNIYKFFSKLPMPFDAVILDIGCGSGTLAKWWFDRGYDVLGVDTNEKALEITTRKGIKTQKEDVEHLSFPDNSFDLVYSDGLLEHFVDCRKALSEMFRVSRNLVLTIVPRKCFYNTISSIITKPPTEYKKDDVDWINLHLPFSSEIKVKNIRFGLLTLECIK